MRRDLVVIGASAGGVEALRQLVGDLPADLPAAVLVVLHVPPGGGTALPAILDRSGPLPVRHAVAGEALRPGQVYVAPPDVHLLVHDGHLSLSRGPRENGHRPALDPLLRSVARWRPGRSVGLVLSGTLDDGAAGLAAMRRRGAACVVQDADDAAYRGMPEAALRAVPDARVAPLADLAALVTALLDEEVDDVLDDVPRELRQEVGISEFDPEAVIGDPDRPGTPSGLPCPDCNGVLFEVPDDDVLRFRCRVGHAWASGSLLQRQDGELESALWMALRVLEDKGALNRQMAERARQRGSRLTAVGHERTAEDVQRAALALRGLLVETPWAGEPTAAAS